MPRHLPSRRAVSEHLPSGCSACLTEAECQGRCRPDEGCQGIYLLNVARVLQTQNVKANLFRTQSVKANVVRTTCATASAFRTKTGRYFPSGDRVSRQMSSGRCVPRHLHSGRVVSSPSGGSVSYRHRVSREMGSRDEAYDGVPHIGNTVVTVVASKRDRHGTVHCSEDYKSRIWLQAM